jgi:hypothetical protein
MELDQFALRSKGRSSEQLLQDEDFKRSVRTRAIYGTGLASELVFHRPYIDERNAQFALSHKKAWAVFISNLANWENSPATLELPRLERVLITAWHFPQVANLFPFARRINALLLVYQDVPWLESLRTAGCTLNLSAEGATRQLMSQMRAGRVVATMLDHGHPDTRCEAARFLGRTVQTPSGIFDLCSRLGYLMVFVAPRGERIEVVEQIDTSRKTPAELAQQYNFWLEAEVKRDPALWLMWQALQPR